MSTITFDPASFRAQIPEFSNPVKYPDSVLQGYWDIAICYVSNEDSCSLSGDCRRTALNYMTAHLLKLDLLASEDGITLPGNVTQSTVDKTSVTLQAPPESSSQFKYWLNKTPYGQALLALLSVKSAGGFFAGSQFPRAGIRQPNGRFLA